MKNKNGIDIEITEKEIEEYATCTSCKKPSSYIVKTYWFNGKLYCLVYYFLIGGYYE